MRFKKGKKIPIVVSYCYMLIYDCFLTTNIYWSKRKRIWFTLNNILDSSFANKKISTIKVLFPYMNHQSYDIFIIFLAKHRHLNWMTVYVSFLAESMVVALVCSCTNNNCPAKHVEAKQCSEQGFFLLKEGAA